MEQRRLKFDPRLLIRKSRADMHCDAEHASIKMGHGTAKICHDPDEGVLVNKVDVQGDHVVSSVAFSNTLVDAKKIGCHASLVLYSHRPFLPPIFGFELQNCPDELYPSTQFRVIEFSRHGITATFERHDDEILIFFYIVRLLLNGREVRVIVPQKASFTKILKRLKKWLGLGFVVLCSHRLFERREVIDRTI